MNSINRLLEHDLMLGTLAKEALECHIKRLNTASLACLFIFVEQGLKMCLDKAEGNISQLNLLALKEKKISVEEFTKLDNLREMRNKLFHESHYAWFYEKEGDIYPFSEDVTKEVIFNDFSDDCFNIILKLL